MSTTPPVPPPAPPDAELAPGDHRLASPWQRVGARVLDFLVAGMVLGTLVRFAIVGDADAIGPDTDATNAELFLANLAALAVWFVWEGVMTAWKGGTPMKLALGLRVVRSDTGGPIGWRSSIVRWTVLAVWSVLPWFGLMVQVLVLAVSLVFLFSRPLRQTVWDLAAKTLVVTAR